MRELPILDPHVHFWDPRSTPRETSIAVRLLGWNGRLLERAKVLFPRSALDFVGRPDFVLDRYQPGDHRRDRQGFNVRGFVHVQAGWRERGPLGPVGETRWLESLCGDDLRGIVGQAALDAPHLAEVLDSHRAASSRFVGVRDMTAWDADPAVMKFSDRGDRMREASWRRGLELVGERGLTFDAWCYSGQLRDLTAAAKTAPHTRIVLCHLGTPIGYGGPFGAHGRTEADRADLFARWRDDLAELGSLRNVHAKISGLAMPILGFGFHARSAPPTVAELADKLGPLVEHALAVFGDDRCFFASNFPMDKVSAPWRTIFEAFAQLVRARDDEARDRLFHDNAARFYGLIDR